MVICFCGKQDSAGRCEHLGSFVSIIPSPAYLEQERQVAAYASLIRQAVAARGTPEDIPSWAKKLAAQTAVLND